MTVKPTVYIAAMYERKAEMAERLNDLTRLGFACTSRWIWDGEMDKMELDEVARVDEFNVLQANALVFFAEPPDSKAQHLNRGGRHVEFGIARAMNKPIYVIGDKENVFHHREGVFHFATWDEFVGVLTLWPLAAAFTATGGLVPVGGQAGRNA